MPAGNATKICAVNGPDHHFEFLFRWTLRDRDTPWGTLLLRGKEIFPHGRMNLLKRDLFSVF
jgi:hypothetical protein